MPDRPYYSVVVTSRNDGHGGNILKRMRLFVHGLLHQTRKYKLPMELIFVEWNPPADRPPLAEILPQPVVGDQLEMRFIQVPAEIQARFKRAQEIPLFQMIAKNVGIRRAKGEFILATNIDLLFSDALFEILAKKNLDPKKFYRANRCDVPDELEESWTFAEQMVYCEKNIMRRLGWDARFRFIKRDGAFGAWMPALLKWGFNLLSWLRMIRVDRGVREFYLLDMMACGDFTMLHRDAWFAMHGYAELDLYSIHVDSLGLVSARSLGLEQKVFPGKACAYHIDHPQGWESMGPVEKLRFLEQRPGIGYGVLWEIGTKSLSEKGKELIFNDAHWGYAKETFAETVLRPQPSINE